jgi:threonine/homoserine/homoserine lactone efflux protein
MMKWHEADGHCCKKPQFHHICNEEQFRPDLFALCLDLLAKRAPGLNGSRCLSILGHDVLFVTSAAGPMPTGLQILAAMITPAVLISACGTLVFSTANRLSRVVDRVRSLADQIERMGLSTGSSGNNAKKDLFLDQLSRLSRRVLLLRSALTGFYVAIGLFVSTSIAVGVVSITHVDLSWIPVVLGLSGSLVLLYAAVLLISEARQAVTSTLKEMDYMASQITRAQREESGS